MDLLVKGVCDIWIWLYYRQGGNNKSKLDGIVKHVYWIDTNQTVVCV